MGSTSLAEKINLEGTLTGQGQARNPVRADNGFIFLIERHIRMDVPQLVNES